MADETTNNPAFGSMADIARAMNLSHEAVRKHKNSGLISPGKDGLFDIARSVSLIETNRDPIAAMKGLAGAAALAGEQGEKAAFANSPMLKARTMGAVLDVQAKQINVARLKGELILKEDARRACLAIVAEIKVRLDGLPSAVAPMAHAAPSVAEAEQIIRAAVRAAMVEVSRLGEAA
jgi:hypothetical protein